MSNHSTANSLVSSLFFYIKANTELPKKGLRPKLLAAISKSLETQNPSIAPKFDYDLFKVFCENLSDQLGINFYPSFFAFPWPKGISFSDQEIQEAWRNTMLDPKFGNFLNADLIQHRTPIIKRSVDKCKWIVLPHSPVPMWVFLNEFGVSTKQIETDPSHTDIKMKLEKRAANGEVDAMYSLVQELLAPKDEKSIQPDSAYAIQAKNYLEKILSVEPKNPAALRDLAFIYHVGAGVNKDLMKAERLFKKAAELNDMQAQHILGFSYDYNGEYETDLEEAFRYHELAVISGNQSSIDCMAVMYIHDRGVPNDFDVQFLIQHLIKGAERSDPDCYIRLATLLEKIGKGDSEECFQLYKKAADAELPPKFASNNVARQFQYGLGCDRDLESAEKYYQREIYFHPNDEVSYLNLSLLVADRRRDLVEARVLLDQAENIVTQDSKNFGIIHKWSANLHSLAGNFSMARDILSNLVTFGVEGAELQLYWLDYWDLVVCEKTRAKAVSYIRKASEDKNLDAMKWYSLILIDQGLEQEGKELQISVDKLTRGQEHLAKSTAGGDLI